MDIFGDLGFGDGLFDFFPAPDPPSALRDPVTDFFDFLFRDPWVGDPWGGF